MGSSSTEGLARVTFQPEFHSSGRAPQTFPADETTTGLGRDLTAILAESESWPQSTENAAPYRQTASTFA